MIHRLSMVDYRTLSVQKFGNRTDLVKFRQEDISPG